MTRREIMRNPALVAAALALVASGGTLVWASSRALQLEPVSAAAPPRFATAEAVGTPRTTPQVDVRAAVELNAFSPERTAPARRYRLTGYDAEPASAPPPPQPLVLGTAVADGAQGFAIAKVGDGRPTVVRVGDVIEGYTVRLIERGHVVFTSPTGERLEIRSNR